MLRIYSSLSRTKEPFQPVEPGKVRMYVCGMTVYDFCHLGHARMLVSFDIIQRWLRATGYEVRYVRNITDIDDKIIRRSVERNLPISEVTAFYTAAMHADEKALLVESPDFEPRATEHVGDMLGIIKRLKDNDLAYQSDDGDVNFAVRKFEGYGKLSGKSLDDLRAGERVAVSTGKRDPLDFVLWKAAKEDEPSDSKWDSPYGVGRPGWHIECSAMSHAILGMPLDIHGGGPDLKFPHHENEIAQSEGAFGGEMASVWMHCGPLMVDADKMSKSLGNFYTIRETISQGVDDSQADYQANPREAEMLRFFIARNHYRSTQNYAPDNLFDSQLSLDRLYQTLATITPATNFEIDWESEFARKFAEAMNDDFNSAGAVAVLFDIAHEAHRQKSSALSAELKALGGILGLLQSDPSVYFRSATRYLRGAKAVSTLSDEEIDRLIEQRHQAKESRNFNEADAIRDSLREQGIELEDKAGGKTQWRRA